jgi:ribosome-associated protein
MKQKIASDDQQFLDQIAQAIYEKKGKNILAIDVRDISSLTEYFVIAEGNVERHVGSIARTVVDELTAVGLKCYALEGVRSGDWVVIDFGHIFVHLFHPDMREKYALEHIWKAGEIVDLNIVLERGAE